MDIDGLVDAIVKTRLSDHNVKWLLYDVRTDDVESVLNWYTPEHLNR